jgi:hypothetical protein
MGVIELIGLISYEAMIAIAVIMAIRWVFSH